VLVCSLRTPLPRDRSSPEIDLTIPLWRAGRNPGMPPVATIAMSGGPVEASG
jgi:hypothetical protein